MIENPKPLWPKIVVTLALVPVLYVLSFGPACWLVDRGHLAAGPAAFFYSPVMTVSRDLPHVETCLNWYGRFGGGRNAYWTMTRIYDAAGLIPFKTGFWPLDMHPDAPYRSEDAWW